MSNKASRRRNLGEALGENAHGDAGTSASPLTKNATRLDTVDNENSDGEDKPKPLPGRGATVTAAEVAGLQLDSDDEVAAKHSKLSGCKRSGDEATSKVRAQLRRERSRLYELQESKRRKREEVERSKKKKDDETPYLQKVKRLKNERRVIEDEYKNTGGSMKKSRGKKKKRSLGIPLPKK